MKTVSLRYFNVFGPRQLDDSPYTGVIAIFAKALLEGRAPTIFGDGEQTRDLTYIDNVVQANLLAMSSDLPPGTVINIGAGERITINELFTAMSQLIGIEGQRASRPARGPATCCTAWPRSNVHVRLLGYSPRVPWREGLATTLEWYRSCRAVASRA
jgi:UDP-glucose 4-epimerase